MSVQSIDLAWVVVKNLQEAIKFYRDTVGLKLMEVHEEYGWAEFQGSVGGARLGVAQMSEHAELKPGQNACVSFSVIDLDKAKAEAAKQGAKFVGDIQEIPGHVKMQTLVDSDGNHFQLVQKLG